MARTLATLLLGGGLYGVAANSCLADGDAACAAELAVPDETPLIQLRGQPSLAKQCPPFPEECQGIANPSLCVYMDESCVAQGGLGCVGNSGCRYCDGPNAPPCPAPAPAPAIPNAGISAPAPGPASTCALGKYIRVVTDMGFDDWGAFALLNKAGCTPQKALAVEGMMHSSFSSNFSRLLRSWNMSVEVYQGDGTCYGGSKDKTCYPKLSWLDTDYRPTVYKTLPNSTGLPWASVIKKKADVKTDTKGFWNCTKGQEYTLLVISPQSAVAYQLLDKSKGAATLKCIKEIVFMGGVFGPEQLSQTDPAVGGNMAPVRGKLEGTGITEVNIISDVPAANALWQTSMTKVGKPMRILSLETASCAHVGLQNILLRGQTGIYTDKDQFAEEEKAVAAIRKKLDCKKPPNMLTMMFCIHTTCDVATLDFDVAAATYIWLGDKNKTVSWNFKQILPQVNLTTGVTTQKDGTKAKSNVWLATTFDAPAWLKLLTGKLLGK